MDGSSPSTDVLLLRHAESEWNAEGRWQGRADPALSSKGRAAAVRASALLTGFPAVVSSNLTRARETARLIARASTCAGLAWVTPLLAERSAGPWEGLTREEIELRWPGYLARRERPPGYEPDESALRRLQAALGVLERDFRGSRVLCVTHGGLVHALEAWAGLPRTRLENLAGRWVTLRDGVVALGARDGRARDPHRRRGGGVREYGRMPETERSGEGHLQAVVLDVDGTLVDSERDGHRVAFNRAFEEAGLGDRWDVERYGELLAVTGGERRINAYFEEQGMAGDEREELASRLHARKTEIFTEMASQGEIEARPGVSDLLDELESAGVRLAVATTGTRKWVEPLLDRLFGLDRFEAIVASDDAPERKPDPSAHQLTLERLGLTASAAPGLEDSANGLRAAKSAGLACVVVVNDYTREQDFHDADLVLDGFGSPDAPASVLADPHGLDPPGRLDVETLRRLAALSGSSD